MSMTRQSSPGTAAVPVHRAARTNFRQMPAGVLARSYPRGMHIGLHVHPEAQLLYAPEGLMQVGTPEGCWFVPPERAVWLPPRTQHTVDVLADLEMRALLIEATQLAAHEEAARLNRPFVVTVAPLLREVILGAFADDTGPALRRLLTDVALHQLPAAEDPGSFMPMPTDPRARRVAEMVLADPRCDTGLADLASRAGASMRTISRLFPAQTGLSFKAWRQRARISASLPLLGRGDLSVKQVSARLGFAGVAAFSHAFRQVTGRKASEMAAHGRGARSAHRPQLP